MSNIHRQPETPIPIMKHCSFNLVERVTGHATLFIMVCLNARAKFSHSHKALTPMSMYVELTIG